MVLAIGAGAVAPDNLKLLIVSLILNGAGQGIVIPLALNAALSRMREDQAGMGSGMVSTMQIVGTSVGVAIVGVLFFSALHQGASLVADMRAAAFGHALARATVYNVVTVTASFLGFLPTRRADQSASRPVGFLLALRAAAHQPGARIDRLRNGDRVPLLHGCPARQVLAVRSRRTIWFGS